MQSSKWPDVLHGGVSVQATWQNSFKFIQQDYNKSIQMNYFWLNRLNTEQFYLWVAALKQKIK